MVCLLEQGRPCSQKTLEKHNHFQEGFEQMNEEFFKD
jgi:hypothetical protein